MFLWNALTVVFHFKNYAATVLSHRNFYIRVRPSGVFYRILNEILQNCIKQYPLRIKFNPVLNIFYKRNVGKIFEAIKGSNAVINYFREINQFLLKICPV